MLKLLVPPAASAAVLAVLAAVYARSVSAPETVPGLLLAGRPVGATRFDELPRLVKSVEDAVLAREVALTLGGAETRARWRDLGARVDAGPLLERLRRAGKSGDPTTDLAERALARRGAVDVQVPLALDRARAVEFLADLKERVDRPPVDAKLDLEKHAVTPEQEGTQLAIYPSLVALEYATASAARAVALSAVITPPRITKKDLGDIDISTVISVWETKYSTAATDSDRTYNLKVGAAKLDGTVIRPGELFSFNAQSGDRTEKEGYRVAPVIQEGELIDGLAGGMCQIATTLHAAAWFGGLDIVSSRPHSRPSVYITMGLDSTVVYPSVDLKLRNPFPFPVVIHYTVSQGTVRVELLGKQRRYRAVFEREILEDHPFQTVTRKDPELPAGVKVVDQPGHDGYRIKRRRFVYEGPELVSKREDAVSYPSTTQYVRVGTGPASIKAPPPASHHKIPDPEPGKGKTHLFRIERG